MATIPLRARRLLAPIALGALGGCLLQRAGPEVPARGVAAPPPEHQVRRTVDKHTKQVLSERVVAVEPDGRTVKDGLQRTWYPDGSPRSERRFAAGEPAGVWRSWYQNGVLEQEYEFSDEPTTMRYYHPDGALSAEGPARRGVREGEWSYWYPSGVLRQRGGYLGGLREGEWTLFYENGGLRSRGPYRADERVGTWRHWRPEPPVLEELVGEVEAAAPAEPDTGGQ